ncbi:hypothetical protein GQ54DRAFT_297628 [Martensiomyces pterosporus]|nr:hypothetical protein GQ54DRAFT_297628 [Martensiomyces pterosporus]
MFLSYLLRSTYVLLASIALAFELFPWTREAFIKYGKTRRADAPDSAEDSASEKSLFVRALEWFAQQTVPKYMFAQFYSIGVIVSALLTMDIVGWNKYQTNQHLASVAPKFYLQFYMDLEENQFGHPRGHFVAFPHKLAIIALGMYNLHVILRLKETVYDQPATNARMHVGQYAVGVLFYIVTPFAVVADSFYSPGWEAGSPWTVVVGIAVFLWASVRQWRCHHILFKLRYQTLREENERKDAEERQSEASEAIEAIEAIEASEDAANGGGAGPSTSSAEPKTPSTPVAPYVIPTGDLFNYVSCPHFLCEIIIYISIWLATSCQSNTLLFVIGWEVVNLGITAKESQQWYKRTFGDKYPRTRRALVPFLW